MPEHHPKCCAGQDPSHEPELVRWFIGMGKTEIDKQRVEAVDGKGNDKHGQRPHHRQRRWPHCSETAGGHEPANSNRRSDVNSRHARIHRERRAADLNAMSRALGAQAMEGDVSFQRNTSGSE